MKKRGQILVENVIFLTLNLIFLSILIGFIFLQGGGKIILEENYAKQIALLIDASESDTNIILNVGHLLKEKDKNFPLEKIITIDKNRVIVSLNVKSKGNYGFFSDVSVNAYTNNQNLNEYIIVIRKNEKYD